jgi:hypothetical protein
MEGEEQVQVQGIARNQGNFTAEHVIARGKMIKNLRALDG